MKLCMYCRTRSGQVTYLCGHSFSVLFRVEPHCGLAVAAQRQQGRPQPQLSEFAQARVSEADGAFNMREPPGHDRPYNDTPIVTTSQARLHL